MEANKRELTAEAHEASEERSRERRVRAPRYSARETEGGLSIELDLPGVSPNAIEVDLEGRELTVRASTAAPELPSGFRAVSTEFESVDFERRFTLARDVDAESVGATFRNGVLVLTLGSKAPVKSTIPVIEA